MHNGNKIPTNCKLRPSFLGLEEAEKEKERSRISFHTENELQAFPN